MLYPAGKLPHSLSRYYSLFDFYRSPEFFFLKNPFFTSKFLAHRTKGHVSFCHHIVTVVYHNLSHLNLFLWNHWTKLSKIWLGWSLGGPISKLCLSPLTLWVWNPLRRGVLDSRICDKVCQWLATGRWYSLGTPISSTNKTNLHDITKILFKHHKPNQTWNRLKEL